MKQPVSYELMGPKFLLPYITDPTPSPTPLPSEPFNFIPPSQRCSCDEFLTWNLLDTFVVLLRIQNIKKSIFHILIYIFLYLEIKQAGDVCINLDILFLEIFGKEEEIISK